MSALDQNVDNLQYEEIGIQGKAHLTWEALL